MTGLEALAIHFIKKGIKRIMFRRIMRRVLNSKTFKGKLTIASVLPLIIGAVAGAFGIDIAPTTVDLIVTFVSSLGVTIGYARAVYQALRDGMALGGDGYVLEDTLE